MKGVDRKAAIEAYKKRKSTAGVFAVRCVVSGEIWVGRTPDLDMIQNRIWFTLRTGAHPSRSLSAAWSAHGSDSFAFEALERLDEEESPHFRDALLAERAAYWRSKLGASTI